MVVKTLSEFRSHGGYNPDTDPAPKPDRNKVFKDAYKQFVDILGETKKRFENYQDVHEEIIRVDDEGYRGVRRKITGKRPDGQQLSEIVSIIEDKHLGGPHESKGIEMTFNVSASSKAVRTTHFPVASTKVARNKK